MKSIQVLFSLVIVVVLLAACQDPSSAAPTYVSPDGGALGGGWWLIPIVIAGIGFAFLYFSFEAIKKGESWIQDDPRSDPRAPGYPQYPGIRKNRPTSKKWYQTNTGKVAIGLWALAILALIIRVATF
jgi:hypothetical protein